MKNFLAVSVLFASLVSISLQAQDQSWFMNTKNNIVMFFTNMSHIQQFLSLGLLVLFFSWILMRVWKCGKGGCGCSCGPSCNCR